MSQQVRQGNPYGRQGSDVDNRLDNQEGVSSKYQGGVTLEPAEIDLSLFNRLIKVSVIKASPSIKTLNDKGKCLKCINGYSLNNIKIKCECKNIINKYNGYKCQTGQ